MISGEREGNYAAIYGGYLNLQRMVFGPDNEYERFVNRAHNALIRYPSEEQLFELARAGYHVIGVDTSQESIDQTRAAAEAEGLDMELHLLDFLDYETDKPLDAILVFGLVQTLTRAECASLFHRIYTWSTRETVLMLTAWHVDDPIYTELSETWEKAGLHSFRSASGDHRTFLPKGQIRDIFLQWRVLHYREYLGPIHGHGDNPEHQHGNVDFIACRK